MVQHGHVTPLTLNPAFAQTSGFVPEWENSPEGFVYLLSAVWASDADAQWEPTNNDLPPTEPVPWEDYDLPTYAEMNAEWAEQHEALMGGWCAHHPDRPVGAPIVAGYSRCPS